jgi:hypothetical protein
LPLLILAAIAIPATSMSAATYTPPAANWSFALSPGSTTASLPQFNPALGTLTSVEISIDALIQASITGENDSATAGNMTANLSGNATAAGPSGLSATAAINASSGPVSLAATDGTSGSGPDFHDFGAVSGSDSDTDLISSSLSPYIGAGSVSYNINGSGGFSLSGVSNSTLTIDDFGANGTIEVTYTYTPVPEPASLAMMASGVAMLIGLARPLRRGRRNAKSALL